MCEELEVAFSALISIQYGRSTNMEGAFSSKNVVLLIKSNKRLTTKRKIEKENKTSSGLVME